MTGSGIPAEDLGRVKVWCRADTPEQLADRVVVEHHVEGRVITLCESHAPWEGQGEWTHEGFAQLRLRPASGDYSLHWQDGNLRWRKYAPERREVTGSCEELLAEISADPYALFRG